MPSSFPAAHGWQGEKRVLVVTDDISSSRPLLDLLELLGHFAEAVVSNRLLAVAQEVAPEVVLCDLTTVDCPELWARGALRRDPSVRSARFVALCDQETVRAGAAFDATLIKPVGLLDLQEVLVTGHAPPSAMAPSRSVVSAAPSPPPRAGVVVRPQVVMRRRPTKRT